MQITIDTPINFKIADVKVSLEIPQEMILPLFFGYLVMNGSAPDEIGKALDDMPKENIPEGWEMVASMWRNRNTAADVKDVYAAIIPWLKEAL